MSNALLAGTADPTTVAATQRSIARELGVVPTFDPFREIERRVAFLADALTDTGRTALVLGISGGVDSAAAGRLCQLAVERARHGGNPAAFTAMRLPYGEQRDEQDARAALAFIRPDRVLTVDIRPASDASLHMLLGSGLVLRDAHQQDFVLGNIKARQRMVAQYAVAGAIGGLVVGTDHAAEAVTGFFTKHGDGAADLVPLAGLTKRRVRAVAHALGVPASLIHKTPTADIESLHPGKPDEEVLGFSYDDIDDFLEGRPVRQAVARAVHHRYENTAHKRRPAAAPAAPAGEPRP
ncbi:ammonia-dependent NAD(+) synthetase [Micromonospora phytophila]|uniref:ammonia-dependent NAD(+) synthetase n=1 Tax=Micromonospora phytophila TaxID=709888 RepID=UPI00202E0854|nr:ammonia-dependent NAD(+) synthetase [Micromonospora phytophila]MCM0676586.1 ammonia-dependent NAD(+) synthetase [Micromonospora phytophila]